MEHISKEKPAFSKWTLSWLQCLWPKFWILLASMQSSGLILFFLFASSKLRVPLFAHWTQNMVSKLPKQIENLREAQFVYWLLRIEFRSSFSFSLMMKCDMIVNLVNSDSEIGKLAAGAAYLTSEDSLAFSVDGLQDRPGFLCLGTYYLFILALKSLTLFDLDMSVYIYNTFSLRSASHI